MHTQELFMEWYSKVNRLTIIRVSSDNKQTIGRILYFSQNKM
jgi:hypothetical protein